MAYTGPFPINVADGGTGFTSKPCFSAVLSAPTGNNVTGDGTVYTVICNTVLSDNTSSYNNSTGIYTVPVTGTYLFTCSIYLLNLGAAHTDGTWLITTSSQGQATNAVNPFAVSIGGQCSFPVSCTVKLTAADTVRIKIVVNGSTKTVGVYGNNDLSTCFGGFLVG